MIDNNFVPVLLFGFIHSVSDLMAVSGAGLRPHALLHLHPHRSSTTSVGGVSVVMMHDELRSIWERESQGGDW